MTSEVMRIATLRIDVANLERRAQYGAAVVGDKTPTTRKLFGRAEKRVYCRSGQIKLATNKT
jgi:hypothetical protein